MGTRTWSRKGVLTAAGKRRQASLGVNTQTYESSLSDQPAWFPYDDDTYYDAALLPVEVQEMIAGGGKRESDRIDNLDESDYELRKNLYEGVGLDIDSLKDRQIMADLLSYFYPENGVESSRGLDIEFSNTIYLYNNIFGTEDETPDGVGYAMIARQLAAAKEVARRTGKEVQISVNAENNIKNKVTGFSVWPKLGYDFEIPESIQKKLIEDFGFKENQVDQGTAKFMLEFANRRYMGFDVWREATEDFVTRSYTPSGTTVVYPDDRESPAMRITREYGRNKGFIKLERQPTDLFSGGPLSEEDDNALRQAWLTLAKKRTQ